jgi:hypothetical protein
LLDRSILRSTAIPVIRTMNAMSLPGPSLNATGNDVNISTVVLATETIPPL